MQTIEIKNKLDEVFIHNQESLKLIRNEVVVEIQKESEFLDAIKNDSELKIMRVSELLRNGPELFKVNILGLEITIACLENLLNWDLMNPEWDIMYKINQYDAKLNNVGILYNTTKDGLENLNYDIILERLEKDLKSKLDN